MKRNINNNERKGFSILNVLHALCFVLISSCITACSSDDDAFFTVSENDYPRILNTDLGDKVIDRKTNLVIELRVTPMEYTTVTWLLNGEQIAEGFTLNQKLPVGYHELRIVATTTKGKSTYRIIHVNVTPAEGDPILANDAKSRWLTIGTTKTIACENVTTLTHLYVGNIEATNVSYANGAITFDVPNMPEGEYMLDIVDAEGERYGCGLFTVSNEPYADPGVQETVLWEGEQIINWGDANVNILPETLSNINVGAKIRVYYEMVDAEYHAFRVTTPQWGDNAEDNIVAQFDITSDTPNPFEFTYSAAHKELVDNRGGMLFVGFGYKITKIVAEEQVAPVEESLWEGAQIINWGDSNVQIATEDMAGVQVGAKIRIYYELVDAEYHAMRITTPRWGDNAEDNIVGQFDITGDTPNPFEFEYTDAGKALVDEREGMLIVGFGYKVTKVTYEK